MKTKSSSDKQDLIGAIVRKRRELKNLVDTHGALTVFEYLRTLRNYEVDETYLPRLDYMCALVEELYAPLWGKKLVQRAASKLRRQPSIITWDHAGVLMYPIYIQGNTLFGLPELLEDRGVILSFSSGLVPVDTDSTPGGLYLSDTYQAEDPLGSNRESEAARKLHARIFLYTKRRVRHRYACHAPGFDEQTLKSAPGRIHSLVNRKIITRNKAKILRALLDKNLRAPRVREQNTLIRQAALINRELVKEYFPDAAGVEFLGFQLEHLATEWLVRELGSDESECPTVELILNEKWRSYAKTAFNGINPGCWSLDEQGRLRSGTFLFWGMDPSGRAVRLFEEGGTLYGKGGFSTKIDRQSILTGLREGRIAPSLFLVFSVMAFETGLSCFGGFMQCWYLERMKKNWMRLLLHFGLAKRGKLYQTIPVHNYVTGLTLFLMERNGEYFLPDGADIIERNGIKGPELDNLARTTLSEAFLPGLPFIYQAIFGPHARLSHVGIPEILEGLDLHKKIVLRAG